MKNCETREKLIQTAIELVWTESYGSVSVDDICRKAGVHKGSFYHFFPSKVDLAIAAFETNWKLFRPEVERIFSPEKTPLERLSDYCKTMKAKQAELKKEFGFVPGCPFTSVGTEQGTQQEKLRECVARILKEMRGYFAITVRDYMNERKIPGDPEQKTDALYSFYLGALVRARIANDLSPLDGMKEVFLTLIESGHEVTV